MRFDDEEIPDKNDYKLRIQGYSLIAMIYGCATGALGLYTIERFAEGKYTAGIVGATLGALCGIFSYGTYKVSANDAKEVLDRNNIYEQIIIKQLSAKKQGKPIDGAFNGNKSLEQICNSNEGGKVLPFRKNLNPNGNEGPKNPAA